MNAKKFPCKIEEVPMIGELVIVSAERDIEDFSGYSSLLTADYFASVKAKIEVCKELVKSSAVAKELKSVTLQLYDKTKNFRIKLNALEGYLKLGADMLDVSVKDINIKNVRTDITRGNVGGLLSNMKTSLIAVKRNQPVLEAQGMKPMFIDEIETYLQEIESLYEKQSELTIKRNRLTVDNIDKFNDLWSCIKLIINTAKAIYSGINEVKLKDYTITQLKKKIGAGN
jgi:hypothetical protein